jgi:hypothetical protein
MKPGIPPGFFYSLKMVYYLLWWSQLVLTSKLKGNLHVLQVVKVENNAGTSSMPELLKKSGER